jgi:hypothetical protein
MGIFNQAVAQHALLKQLLPPSEEAEEQVSQWERRLKHADECTQLYSQTIDKKTSDLTVRETELVKACQSISLYPPQKYQERSTEPPVQPQ